MTNKKNEGRQKAYVSFEEFANDFYPRSSRGNIHGENIFVFENSKIKTSINRIERILKQKLQADADAD